MSDEHTTLDRGILRAHRIVQTLIAVAVLTYTIWFVGKLNYPLSPAPGDWGIFGDFFGGVLNPIIAYAAFYWLTQAVKLQKQELSETRAALKDTAEAQNEQARHAKETVRLNALAALATTIGAEIQICQRELEFLIDQRTRSLAPGVRTFDDEYLEGTKFQARVATLNTRVQQRFKDRIAVEHEITEILSRYRENAP